MERDRSLDGLKFILVFLVILLHIKYISLSGNEMFLIIHSFVMPFFILLSGYFTKVTTWERYFQWTLKIIGIYLIFDALHSMLSVWLYQKNLVSDFVEGLMNPHFAMWYLMSLLWWRTITQIVGTWREYHGWSLCIIAVLLSLLMGFVPLGREFSFQRTFAWFPFFIVGYLFRQKGTIEWIRSQKVWYFIPVLLVALYVATKLPYYVPVKEYSSLHAMMVRALQMLNGFVLSVCMLRLIMPSFASRFGWLGKHSLYFYMYHSLPIYAQRFYFEQNAITVTLPVALAISVGYVVVISLMTQIKPFRWLVLQK